MNMNLYIFFILLVWSFFYYKYFYHGKNNSITIFDNFSPWNTANIIFFFLAYIQLFKFWIIPKENNETLLDFFIKTFIPALFISLSLYIILKFFIYLECKFNKFQNIFNIIKKFAIIFIIAIIVIGMKTFNYEILTNEGKCLEYSYSATHGRYCEEYE